MPHISRPYNLGFDIGCENFPLTIKNVIRPGNEASLDVLKELDGLIIIGGIEQESFKEFYHHHYNIVYFSNITVR
ncbi:hypothetical protein ACUIJN_23225 [Metabacillus halosaccharovorans]|uniref:hypothetical protein n=1 Tax=Metabacillus halosaccharovorans TaxID=930124 RepID=UPI00403D9256